MVCSIGSGRMAVMARILAAGSFSQSIPEVGHQKLISQYIHRELCEADEANLLDEEDMHVYGLMPMEDPLHLVCCNACKKPVKASQYTAHAELCRLLSFEETILEVDGGAGHKKPPRKERKKLLNTHAYQSTISREHERSESIEGDDVASESHLVEQVGTTSFFSMEARRHPACVDVAPNMDYSGVSPGFTDQSAGVVPPTKRSKLITAERLAPPNDLETTCGVAKIISQEASTCRDFPKGSSAGIGKCYNHVVGHHNPGHVVECCLPTKDVPVPLATKVFYSQRSNRLQSAISHMYHEASPKEYCSDFVTQEMLQGNLMSQQFSSPKNFLIEQINDQPEKKRDTHSLPSAPNPDRSESSEACLINEGGCPPAKNFANQFPVNNTMRPHTATVEMLRSKYRSKNYSFAGNSGTSLGTMQQPNGSLPVT